MGNIKAAVDWCLNLHIEVEQPHAFAGELVNAWRGRATENAATVDAQFAIPEVVHQDEDDVWPILLRNGM